MSNHSQINFRKWKRKGKYASNLFLSIALQNSVIWKERTTSNKRWNAVCCISGRWKTFILFSEKSFFILASNCLWVVYEMHFYRALASSLLLLTTTMDFALGFLSTDCQIIVDRTFQPNFTYSLINTIQLQPRSKPTIADCAHLCLRSTPCRTAVFESQRLTCILYREAASSSGRLAANSSGSFSTIITNKPAGDAFLFSTPLQKIMSRVVF